MDEPLQRWRLLFTDTAMPHGLPVIEPHTDRSGAYRALAEHQGLLQNTPTTITSVTVEEYVEGAWANRAYLDAEQPGVVIFPPAGSS